MKSSPLHVVQEPAITPFAAFIAFLSQAFPAPFRKARPCGCHSERLACFNVIVTNPDLEGAPLGRLPVFDSSGIVVSRIKHRGYISLATPNDILHVRDVLLLVGPREELEELRVHIGHLSRSDLRVEKSALVARHVVVSRMAAGRSLGDFDLVRNHKVAATRVKRDGVELSAVPTRRLAVDDTVVLVGRRRDIARLAAQLGHSVGEFSR